ncbi:CehA/McbA family metallohydrolase [Aquibacillus rhizosphaerae]|uniref:CehA/McbA family metallohydrolase n=1 Tax=Aquibacillus rhizosphaerae TaxID=3051431 RepID=A0ABT7L0C3_9BACI|nr:CehA/McbA family metallohydrolase [Aquibacillus sp. LR5S19]MDL4839251.1 CehA/McbA family metallohydrolase [Aquibacillus sp. LR5S19]
MIRTDKNKLSRVMDAQHVIETFNIEQTTNLLELTFSFTENTWAFLLLWDSNEKLRWQYLYTQDDKDKRITIGESSSLSSFSSVAGTIPKGYWKIEIFCMTYKKSPVFNLTMEDNPEQSNVPDEMINVVNWATVGETSGFELTSYDSSKVLKSGYQWYKGDFHTHTSQTDGKMTPKTNIQQAKKMGLDFFVATDHNIVPTKWVDDNQVLVIPGVEITSSQGHFNALGVNKWLDWRPSCEDGGMESEVGMNRILKEVKEAKGLRSINHPNLAPWHWTFQETDLNEVETIEIWNDPTFEDNIQATEQALVIWDTLLNDGHRIFGIGGSDSHLLPEDSYKEGGPPSLIGDPATYVYAKDLSADSILKAVSEGKVYVSRGPAIDIVVVSGEEKVELGSQFQADTVEFLLNIETTETDLVIEWVVNGEIEKTTPVSDTFIKETFDFTDKSFAWIRFNVRKKNGELLAFANPVFKGEKETSINTWGNL